MAAKGETFLRTHPRAQMPDAGAHSLLLGWLRPCFSSGAKHTDSWKQVAISDRNRRFSRERFDIGPLLLMKVNMKS